MFCICSLNAQQLPRNKATHLLDNVWMRDPYIIIGPDSCYYLTYTNGKMEMPVWKSSNLKDWIKLGESYCMIRLSEFNKIQEIRDGLNKSQKVYYDNKMVAKPNENMEPVKLWAPEMYYINGLWYVVHTSNSRVSTIIASKELSFENIIEPFKEKFGMHHDPSLFRDDDGTIWMIDKCAEIIKLKSDMSGFEGKPIRINPANRKMGHEGCQIVKIGNKYVWFGTAWSTDSMRKGTYNLYYTTADNITGPYSERRFAGRCLGHGTVFQDKKGQWWCTAFLNGQYETPDKVNLGVNPDIATSMNKQGLTLVPMSIETVDGDVVVRALDSYYRFPGTEEIQQFALPQ